MKKELTSKQAYQLLRNLRYFPNTSTGVISVNFRNGRREADVLPPAARIEGTVEPTWDHVVDVLQDMAEEITWFERQGGDDTLHVMKLEGETGWTYTATKVTK